MTNNKPDNGDDLFRRDFYRIISPYKNGSRIFDKLADDFEITIVNKNYGKLIILELKEEKVDKT